MGGPGDIGAPGTRDTAGPRTHSQLLSRLPPQAVEDRALVCVQVADSVPVCECGATMEGSTHTHSNPVKATDVGRQNSWLLLPVAPATPLKLLIPSHSAAPHQGYDAFCKFLFVLVGLVFAELLGVAFLAWSMRKSERTTWIKTLSKTLQVISDVMFGVLYMSILGACGRQGAY